MHKLMELKETLCAELEEYAKRGSNLDVSSLEAIDTLAHAIKNLDKVIEAKEMKEYSQRSNYMNNSYESGRSYNEGGWSNRGGRGRYSYGDAKESFKKLMENAPDEQTRMELSRMMQRFE